MNDTSENALQKLLAHASANLVPLCCLFELTYRCNLRCIHCYNAGSGLSGEMDVNGIRRILDDFVKAGVFFIIFSGGEIFLRDDVMEILREAACRGFVVKIYSNGTLLNEELVDELASLNLAGIEISLYGYRAETHDSITLEPGSHSRSMSSIRLFLTRSIPVTVKTTVMKSNIAEIGILQKLCHDLGAKFAPNANISPGKNRSPVCRGIKIDAADVNVILESGACGSLLHSRTWWNMNSPVCSAGRSMFSMDPSGLIFPCPLFTAPAGDIKTTGFDEIWKNSPLFKTVRAWKLDDFKTCACCDDLTHCTPCPGLFNLYTGNYLTAGTEVCSLTRLLACSNQS